MKRITCLFWSNGSNESAVASGMKMFWMDSQRPTAGFEIIARMATDSRAIAGIWITLVASSVHLRFQVLVILMEVWHWIELNQSSDIYRDICCQPGVRFRTINCVKGNYINCGNLPPYINRGTHCSTHAETNTWTRDRQDTISIDSFYTMEKVFKEIGLTASHVWISVFFSDNNLYNIFELKLSLLLNKQNYIFPCVYYYFGKWRNPGEKWKIIHINLINYGGWSSCLISQLPAPM